MFSASLKTGTMIEISAATTGRVASAALTFKAGIGGAAQSPGPLTKSGWVGVAQVSNLIALA